jgi:anaerobic selenocysteine-containing dehydrogenase
LIVIWGSNSITSNVHFWRCAQEAKRHGAKLICIDPRHSETAEKCHVHVPIKPGTDAALAFAIMRELVVNNWLDQDYIEKYTLGWDALRERAMTWTLERAAEVCGIDEDLIRSLGQRLGHHPQSCHSFELWHATCERRRQCSACCRLFASLNRRMARQSRGHVAEQLQQFHSQQKRFASIRFAWRSAPSFAQHGHHWQRL